MDCSPPASSVHGIVQARILEGAAIPFSRGSSQPRDQTWVSRVAGRFFTIRAPNQNGCLLINHESKSSSGLGNIPSGKADGWLTWKQMFDWCLGNLRDWWPHWWVTSKQQYLENSNFANYLLGEREIVIFSGWFWRHSKSYFSIERLWNVESDLDFSVLCSHLASLHFSYVTWTEELFPNCRGNLMKISLDSSPQENSSPVTST